MKPRTRGERKLAGLLKQLRKLRLAYARALAKAIKVRGSLPKRILEVKARIARLAFDLAHRHDAA
ncbi:MAG TPA: hypothetical protein VEN81_03460 [Planctomycetota bacterium]|nr:hypothetical protein [Planctomycetota bacterium]